MRKSGGLSFIRIPIERDPEVEGRVFVTRPVVLLRMLNPGRQSERKWRRDDVEEKGVFPETVSGRRALGEFNPRD